MSQSISQNFRPLTPGVPATRLWFGADYNPEQWPESVGEEDMRLMHESGVSMVSIGIFGWGLIEQQPGRFDWGWFDRLMDRLDANGIAACLATMTASPPSWLAHRHPEILPVTVEGQLLSPGARQHFCPSSPVYRDYAARFVRELAERYADHPALRIWHVGNEYGCHVAECYCDVSAEAFRQWLEERYVTIEAVNAAWSTSFWSQRYEWFDEILPPRRAPLFANPGQRLDYARFSSDEMLACFTLERDILREVTPTVPVSTNFLSWGKPVDLFAWARELDVVGHDAYQDPADPRTHVSIAFAHDLMRGASGGRPFMLMEQSPGAVNWRERNAPKSPGSMRLWSWQAIAQGADSVMSFQWRQSRGGAEKFHAGIVPHTGTRSRIYGEARLVGNELGELHELAGSVITARVAIVMDWANWWALELDAHPTVDFGYERTLTAHYAPLFEANIAVDVVPPDADLSAYSVVIAPNLYLVTERDAQNLERFARAGGALVVSCFSGIVDEHDIVYVDGYGGPLRQALGLSVEEHWALQEGESVAIEVDGHPGRATVLVEDVRSHGAVPTGRFVDGPFADGAVVTRHPVGTGSATYIGAVVDDVTLGHVLLGAVRDAGVTPALPGVPSGVQATVRRSDDDEFVFLLNHSGEPRRVELGSPAVCILGGAEGEVSAVDLAANDVAILRRPAQRE